MVTLLRYSYRVSDTFDTFDTRSLRRREKKNRAIFFFSPLASRKSLGLLVLAVLDLLGLRGLLGFPAFLELVLELLRVFLVGPRVRTTIERALARNSKTGNATFSCLFSGEGEQLEHARRGMRR
jgi:hypothetical protein